jgi:hypothetical protein
LWIIDWRIFSKIATSHSMEPWEGGLPSQGLPKVTSGKKVERTTSLLCLSLRKVRGERWIEEDHSTFKGCLREGEAREQGPVTKSMCGGRGGSSCLIDLGT